MVAGREARHNIAGEIWDLSGTEWNLIVSKRGKFSVFI
jgi:hypothetical protein